MTEFSDFQVYYTKSGLPRYQLELRHDNLKKYQVIKGDDQYIVLEKAKAIAARWDEMWDKKRIAANIREEKEASIEQAEERTNEAQEELACLERILDATLNVDDTINWDSLKRKDDFPKEHPQPIAIEPPVIRNIPNEPREDDEKYKPKYGLLDAIFSSRKIKKAQASQDLFNNEHNIWGQVKIKITKKNDEIRSRHEQDLINANSKREADVENWKRDKEE